MWVLKKEAKGKIALDIGANIGYSTIYLCKNMKKVIAIEPDKRSRDILLKNIKLHKLNRKVKTYDFAISDINGQEIFYLSKHSNLSAFTKNKKHWLKKKIVDTKTLDSLNTDPNFIKMDLEGYEVEVIRGGMKSLKRTKNCKILMEIHPAKYNEKRNFAVVLKGLLEVGYVFKYIISAGKKPCKLFKKKGYKPFKMFDCGKFKRGIFKYVEPEDAIDFVSKTYDMSNLDFTGGCGKNGSKIARAVMLEKL